MLDPSQDAPSRDSLAQEARGRIEADGTLKHENNWGLRKLAYEIEQRNEADYRWFRFIGPPALLEELDHNLKIADGVLRFRIFKVDPEAPTMAPPTTATSSGRERQDEDTPQQEAPEPAVAQAASASAETPGDDAPAA